MFDHERALLAIDLGTTRVKVAAFSEDGRLLGREAARNREHRLREGDSDRAWQDPDEWWSDAVALTRRLLARPELDGLEIAGIGLSARANGFAAIDADGTVLAPSWSDGRHLDQIRLLHEWRASGYHLSNYAAGLIARWRWLEQNEPAVAERTTRLLYAKDFLVYRLTGEAVTDPTSGPDREDFDPRSIAGLGLPRDLLPRVAMPWTLAGALTSEAAIALGLPVGTPVSVGGHDGICANVGAAAGTVGAYAITIGTHAVVRAVTADLVPDGYRFYGLPPDRHIYGGNAVMAGRAADWFLDTWLGNPDDAGREDAFAAMDAAAMGVPPGSEGVRFLPFLAGQVAPELRPGASGAFIGLHGSHGRAEMFRAVLEGGAFAIRAIFEQVLEWGGEPSVVRFTGSGATSPLWPQIIVDTLRHPVEATDGAVEARGAAMYAAVALEMYADIDEAAQAMVQVSRVVTPDTARADRYDALYGDWQQVNEALRPLDQRERMTGHL
ncbi:MAG: FGGY family carbohydrate kinase [Chloroflexi bacterium]|nr:FGGY family carbohydrate kinase [Chloroflexota bacterium]MDA1146318.1 FGGY family carbohydrate kinase [Chloroflexota bacterium]